MAKVAQIRIKITPGRGRISVGPPGGPTETIPATVTLTITDTFAFDIEARLEWSPTVGKLAFAGSAVRPVPGGDDVSPTGIAHMGLRENIDAALEPSTSAPPAGPDFSTSTATTIRSPSTR